MKKLSLSLGVIILFAFYALLNSNRNSTHVLASNTATTLDVATASSTAAVADTLIQPVSIKKVSTKPKPTVAQALVIPNTITSNTRHRDDEGESEDDDDNGFNTPTNNPTTAPIAAVIPKPATPVVTQTPTKPVSTVNTPVNSGKYKNGSYTGSVVDAYYGNVQVQIVVLNGMISDVQFLQYPDHSSNSVRINTRAMPILKTEVITAQSATIDGVSGATHTSGAFNQSLGVALALAIN